MKINIPLKLIKGVLERDNFSCQKCGFRDANGEELEIHHINPKVFNGLNEINNLSTLCSICHKHAPDTEKEFKEYLSEKIDSKILETFRKSDYSISKKTKRGMINAFKIGRHITKAPRGYKIVNKLLVPSENSNEISKIFQEFLDSEISLTQLAKKNNITPAGIKKLLKNITYIGKVKFGGEISEGTHKPILSSILFNKVQDKIKELGWS
ncbi:MAG: HNH endonuclease [Nanoarchaeota archaeon]